MKKAIILILLVLCASSVYAGDWVVSQSGYTINLFEDQNLIFNATQFDSSDTQNITINESYIAALAGSISDTNESTRMNNLIGTGCGAGEYAYDVDVDGTLICRADVQGASSVDFNSSTIPEINGNRTVNFTTVQARVLGECAEDSSIRVINIDGTVTCEPDSTGLDTTCDGGSCNVANTGTLDGYEASELLDDTVRPKWTLGGVYIYNDTGIARLNETKLNATIDARDTDTDTIRSLIQTNTTDIINQSGNFAINYTTVASVSYVTSALADYYLKTAIDSQGEVETIWGVTLATDTELAGQDECSEITGCIENAVTVNYPKWLLDGNYIKNVSGVATFNEVKLNATIDILDTDTQLTEDQVEAYIFDNDNTAVFNLSGYDLVGLNETKDINSCIREKAINATAWCDTFCDGTCSIIHEKW